MIDVYWATYANNVLKRIPTYEHNAFIDWVAYDSHLLNVYMESQIKIVDMWKMRNVNPDLVVDEGL